MILKVEATQRASRDGGLSGFSNVLRLWSGPKAYFARADDLTLPDRVRIRFSEMKEHRTLSGKPDSPTDREI